MGVLKMCSMRASPLPSRPTAFAPCRLQHATATATHPQLGSVSYCSCSATADRQQVSLGGLPIPMRPMASSALVTRAGKGFGVVKPSPNSAAKKDSQPKELDPKAKCPCGSGTAHEACCRPFLMGTAFAATPEQLLRSRYSAYSLRNPNYVADTTHKDAGEYKGTRSTYLKAIISTQKRMHLVGLRILGQQEGSSADEHFITFKSSFYDREDKERVLQVREETSRFVKDNGRWLYMGSEFSDKLASESQ